MKVEHKIMLFHGGKGIIKCFNICHSVLRVGGCAYGVLVLIRSSLHMKKGRYLTLRIQLDTGNSSLGCLLYRLWCD